MRTSPRMEVPLGGTYLLANLISPPCLFIRDLNVSHLNFFEEKSYKNLGSKVELKLHDLKVAVGYPNETQSFFQIRDRSVIVISKKDYPILYCSFLA